MLVQDIHPEYHPKVTQNFLVPHRDNDTIHYIRKKPTKKMKRVKRFLDKNSLRDDLTKVNMDQELSFLFDKFDHQKQARRRYRINRQIMRGNSQGPPVPRLNTNPTENSFIEYKEYLDLFSYPEANIRSEVKSNPAKNAEIFKKFLTEQKQKRELYKTRRTHDSMGSVPRYFPEKRGSQSSITEKQYFDYYSSYGKPESSFNKADYSLYKPEEMSAYDSGNKSVNSTLIEKSRFESSGLSKKVESITDPFIEAMNKKVARNNFRKLKVIDSKEVQALKEKGEKYLRTTSTPKPRPVDYKLIGNKRMQNLQVDYFQKLGLLDMLKNN
jgi:hypothetical protein